MPKKSLSKPNLIQKNNILTLGEFKTLLKERKFTYKGSSNGNK